MSRGWIAQHIDLDTETLEWVGYDGVGLELCRSKSLLEIRCRIITYATEQIGADR